MGINLQDLIGGSITDGVAKIVSLFKVDPNLAMAHSKDMAEIANEMQTKILDAATAQMQAQTEVNKAEALNPSVFIAGWRPAVGWVCAVGLLSQFLVAPFATWIAALCGHPISYPTLDMGTLLTLVTGMLGLGGLRTYEKVTGVETKGVGQ